MNTSCLFPGQGAQTPGFLHRLPDHSEVRSTLSEAAATLGMDPMQLDTEAALTSTVAVQLSLLIAGVAMMRTLREEETAEGETVIDSVAGLSVGAFGAAVACGALQFDDALRLVKLRGECMEHAYPHGYGMVAIDGLDERQAIEVVKRAGGTNAELYIANINAPRQIVVSGADRSLAAASVIAREVGARRTERLAVSVPSHCPLLNSVAERLATAMHDVAFGLPRIPYVDNRRARIHHDAAGIREDLIQNVAHTVRWHDSVTVLYELGVRLFIEAPPGDILSRLVRQAFEEARAVPLEGTSLTSLAQAAKHSLLKRPPQP
ncbi:MAG TPA: malonate decarboxylase subunit epsilon [Steroidobacteraceae bacterium]